MSNKIPMSGLEDAEARAREFPTTFHLPPLDERLKLRPGDFAKLCFVAIEPRDDGCNGERMWVRVTKCAEDGSYEGVLDNKPTFLDMTLGDSVAFQAKHILQIETPA
jgi:hypothetical protein